MFARTYSKYKLKYECMVISGYYNMLKVITQKWKRDMYVYAIPTISSKNSEQSRYTKILLI